KHCCILLRKTFRFQEGPRMRSCRCSECVLIKLIGYLMSLEYPLTRSNGRFFWATAFFVFQTVVVSRCQDFDRLRKRRVLGLHDELDSVTRSLVRKTVVKALGRSDMKRWRAFIVKWAQTFIRPDSRGSERYVFFNHGFQIRYFKYLID